jgi:hypothetical protein
MEGECCSCKEAVTVYELRKGVVKCAKCACNQVGKSFMDLFMKGIKKIPPPVHVLVAVSGGSSSMFAYDILTKRIDTTRTSKSSVVKKISAISTKDLPIEGLIHIDNFTVKAVCDYAKTNGYNCVVLGDNSDFISIYSLGCMSQGRPDLFPWISQNDKENYAPVFVLRPARQCLTKELDFYCRENGIDYDSTPSPLLNAFSDEEKMMENVKNEGNEATPFTVQKMAEKLPRVSHSSKCPICGLPSTRGSDPCQICNAIENAK